MYAKISQINNIDRKKRNPELIGNRIVLLPTLICNSMLSS